MKNTTILVVEDDKFTARSLNHYLVQLGYIVLATVETGEEALLKVKEFSPDIILMDILLQGSYDGIDTSQKIKAEFDVPVIYITSGAQKELIHRAKLTTPFGFIIKPFTQEDLFTQIEIALYKHSNEVTLKKLQESERFLASITKNIHDAVLTINHNTEVLYQNEAARMYFQQSIDLTTPPSLQNYLSSLQEGFAETIVEKIRYKMMGIPLETEDNECVATLQNKTIWFQYTIDFVEITSKNQQQNLVLIFRDITNSKNAQNALKDSHTLLEHRVEERTKELEQANGLLLQEVANRARAEARLHKLASNRKRLAEIASLIISKTTIEDILQFSKNELKEILAFDDFSYYTMNEETSSLEKMTFSIDDTSMIDKVIPLSRSILSDTYLHNQSILLNNSQLDSRSYFNELTENVTHHMLCFSIVENDLKYGILCVSRFANPEFTQDSFDIVQLLVNFIAVAISKAQLFNSLSTSESRTKVLFERFQEAVLVVDSSGKIVDANITALELLRFDSKQSLMGIKSIEELYFDQTKREQFLRTLSLNGYVRDSSFVLKRGDGSTISVSASAIPIQTIKGQVTLYYAIFTDATKFQDSKHLQPYSDSHFKDVLNFFPYFIAIVTKSVVRYSNTRSLELLGYSAEELQAMNFIEIVHPDQRAEIINRTTRRMNGEDLDPYYFLRIITKSNVEKTLHIHSTRIVFDNEVCILVVAETATDYLKNPILSR
jgi:PAS domain S-box-containing protein